MGLAATGRPQQHQPQVRLLGELPGELVRFPQAVQRLLVHGLAPPVEALEGHAPAAVPAARCRSAHLGRRAALLHDASTLDRAGSVMRERSRSSMVSRVRAGGDDGGQLGAVAVVEELVQLLLGPGGAALGSQVVQDQQGGALHVLEELVVGHLAVRAEGGAQVVQQVRHHHEEGLLPGRDSLVGDGRRQVGLAAAAGAQQHQPALGATGHTPDRRRRPRGSRSRIAGSASPALGVHQVIEGEAQQGTQVAQPLQRVASAPGSWCWERQRQGTSLPKSGWPGATSSRRKPAPLQMGQAGSSGGSSLSA